MARVIRNYPGVVFLVELKWVGRNNKEKHRHFTLYEVRRSSRIKSLCERALETGGDGFDDSKPYSQTRVDAVTKASVQALRPQHR